MKVYPFLIPKPLHGNLIVQEDKAKIFYNQLHQHKEIQLSLVLKGRGKLIVGDSVHPFSESDFFALGSDTPHLFKNERRATEAHMLSLFFTEKTFGNGFFELPDLKDIRPFFTDIKEGFLIKNPSKSIKQSLLQISRSNKFNRFIGFLKLLLLLCQAERRPLTGFVYPKEIGASQGIRMQKIYDYVITNFQNEVDLKSISEIAFMTPNAFCRFFKQHTNKTFFQFLIELRIEHACQLLEKKDTQLSILEISEKSGFTSISNFNRQFKKLKGYTPSCYTKDL